MRPRSPLVSLTLALSIVLASAAARADGSDRADAERILGEVAADKQADATKTEADAARRALDRGRSARDSKDVHHAEMLEGLARTLAETARDLLLAVAAEADATAIQQKAAETRAQVDRERTLLEETISRRGRARVELSRAEAEAASKTPAPAPKEKPVRAKKKDKGASK